MVQPSGLAPSSASIHSNVSLESGHDHQNAGGWGIAGLVRSASTAAGNMVRYAMGVDYSPVNHNIEEGALGEEPDASHFMQPAFFGGGFEGTTKDVGNQEPAVGNQEPAVGDHSARLSFNRGSDTIPIGLSQEVADPQVQTAQQRSFDHFHSNFGAIGRDGLPQSSPLDNLRHTAAILSRQLAEHGGEPEQTHSPNKQVINPDGNVSVVRSGISVGRDGRLRLGDSRSTTNSENAELGRGLDSTERTDRSTFNVQTVIDGAKSFGNKHVVPALNTGLAETQKFGNNTVLPALKNILKAVDSFCSKWVTPTAVKSGQLYAKATSKMFHGAEKFATKYPDIAFVLGAGLFAGSIALAAETAGIGLVVFPVTMPLAAGLIHGAAKEKSDHKASGGERAENGQYTVKGKYTNFSENIQKRVSSKITEYLQDNTPRSPSFVGVGSNRESMVADFVDPPIRSTRNSVDEPSRLDMSNYREEHRNLNGGMF